MGAWDVGSFDNDAALDFADGINGIEDLTQAFDALGEEGTSADADAVSEAVAAADLVAAMMGRPAPNMPDHLAERVAGFGPPEHGLIAAAADAVRHVAAHSELAELWAEAEDEDWAGAMEGLLTRLDPKVPYDPPPQNDAPVGLISSICLICEGSVPEAEEVTVTMEGDDDLGRHQLHPFCPPPLPGAEVRPAPFRGRRPSPPGPFGPGQSPSRFSGIGRHGAPAVRRREW
jgi:hypothetical protein